jgi:signal peptidase I
MGKTLTIAPRQQSKGRGRGTVRKKRAASWWRGSVGYALGIIGLALAIRLFVVQTYRVASRSMEDSLLVGDYLLVDKATYGASIPFSPWRLPSLDQPHPGELIVFRSPLDPHRVYIKRCLAVAGQTVEVRNKVIYVDERRTIDPPFSKYLDARIFPATEAPRDNFGPEQVPEGAIFVVGDNRDNSRDSRHWGFVSRKAIVGRAVWLYWSCEPFSGRQPPGFKGYLHRLADWPQRIRWARLGQVAR